ncbi:NAD(P)-dependent oxidoreductase [Martelella sp. AD-3]|uniref:NAD(P)-dependent oxidoreductase n=1 Tax=Martelella sp. AD-3 TaxID=686597 RepID=UPI000463CDA8|nr:NAD(P)-dependent oxidoreductase [Martelella sp. AD-3]AMM85363.1 hydroxyacid dehydrogenase [Martelella sp. AD-3]
MSEKEVIGICGIGRMGSAIADRLAAKGFRLVLWSRSGVTDEFADRNRAEIALNLASLAFKSDIIITSLINDGAVDSVLSKLVETSLPGKLVVETSTVRPDTLRRFSEKIKAKGGSAIDAPISGGPELVREGTAGIYVGGATIDYKRYLPVAEALSDRIHHTGSLGAGAAAKIVNNMMLCGYWEVLKEALMTGKKAGLSVETMLDVLLTSPGGSPALKFRAPRILGEDKSIGFPAKGALKDATLFAEVAKSFGIDTPAINAAVESYRTCIADGHGDEDLSAMVRTALEKG